MKQKAQVKPGLLTAGAASVMSQTKHNKILRTKNQGLSRPTDSCKNGVPTLANYFTSEERKATPQCVAQWAGRGSENICDGLCYCLARWHRGPVPRCKYILIRLIITHPTHHNTDYSNYSTLILPPRRTPNTQRARGWLQQLGDWIFHCPHQCAGAFSSGFSSGEQNCRFTFPTLLKIYGKNKMCDINLSLSSQYEDYFANLEWDHQGRQINLSKFYFPRICRAPTLIDFCHKGFCIKPECGM